MSQRTYILALCILLVGGGYSYSLVDKYVSTNSKTPAEIAKLKRLDRYCLLMQVTIDNIDRDLQNPITADAARMMRDTVYQFDARALQPCLDENLMWADQPPFSKGPR